MLLGWFALWKRLQGIAAFKEPFTSCKLDGPVAS